MKSMLDNPSLWEDIKHGGMKRQKAIATIFQDADLKNQIIEWLRKTAAAERKASTFFTKASFPWT